MNWIDAQDIDFTNFNYDFEGWWLRKFTNQEGLEVITTFYLTFQREEPTIIVCAPITGVRAELPFDTVKEGYNKIAKIME